MRRVARPRVQRLRTCWRSTSSDEGDEATEGRLATEKTPRKAADGHSLVEDAIDVAAGVLDVDDLVREQVIVHDLDVVIRPDLLEWPAERRRALAGHVRPDLADDGVHRMVCAARVDRQPADAAGLDPVGELAGRAGVLDEVARLVGLDRSAGGCPVRRVVAVIAGMD